MNTNPGMEVTRSVGCGVSAFNWNSPHSGQIPLQHALGWVPIVGNGRDTDVEDFERPYNSWIGASEIVGYIYPGCRPYAQNVDDKDDEWPCEAAEAKEASDLELRFLVCGFGGLFATGLDRLVHGENLTDATVGGEAEMEF